MSSLTLVGVSVYQGIHGGHNNATVGTVANVAAQVPQLNTVYEMRTIILIKIITESIQVSA